jgi:glycosyltransferase involved in cell wall biosynthesis
MKISIITPTYNSSKTISDTLNSINGQTYCNIEHIIIDGLSIDNTLEICREISPNSKIFSEPDFGIYDAMNKGIKMATGDVITILNSDDFYHDENVLENIYNVFSLDNSIDIIYGNLLYVSQHNIDKIRRDWISEPYYNNFFEDSKVPPHPTLFLKKELYSTVGLFNLDFNLAADYDFMFRLFKLHNYSSYHINKYLIKMRLGGATSKNLKNIFLQNLEIYKCWKIYNFKLPRTFFFKKLLNRFTQYF